MHHQSQSMCAPKIKILHVTETWLSGKRINSGKFFFLSMKLLQQINDEIYRLICLAINLKNV